MNRNFRCAFSKVLIGFFPVYFYSGTALGASSNIQFVPAIYYASQSYKDEDSKSESSNLRLNLSIGLKLSESVSIGLKYLHGQVDTKWSSEDESSKTSSTESAYGVLLGYSHANGFYASAAYMLDPANESKQGDTKVIESGPSGIMVDIGYRFKIGSFETGPLLSYYSYEYDTQKINGNENDDEEFSESHTQILPYFAFWVYF